MKKKAKTKRWKRCAYLMADFNPCSKRVSKDGLLENGKYYCDEHIDRVRFTLSFDQYKPKVCCS